MKCTLILSLSSEDGSPNLRIIKRFDSLEEAERFLKPAGVELSGLEAVETTPIGRPGKPVEVVSVNPEVHQAYRAGQATIRSGRPSLAVKPGQIFDSASEASRWLGCRNNEVSIGLSKAASVGDTTATVRGVTFEYLNIKD